MNEYVDINEEEPINMITLVKISEKDLSEFKKEVAHKFINDVSKLGSDFKFPFTFIIPVPETLPCNKYKMYETVVETIKEVLDVNSTNYILTAEQCNDTEYSIIFNYKKK